MRLDISQKGLNSIHISPLTKKHNVVDCENLVHNYWRNDAINDTPQDHTRHSSI